jgi:Spy/CpxP family protein refolding chaperone
MNGRHTELLAIALSLVAAAGWTQDTPATQSTERHNDQGRQARMMQSTMMQQHRAIQSEGDQLERDLYPPELIMRSQGSVGLTEEQRKAIRENMQQCMTKFTDLQWQAGAQADVVSGLLKGERIDEAKVLAEVDKLVDMENQIKRLRLAALIKIKNLLTPEQQKKLDEVRKNRAGMGMGRFEGGMQPFSRDRQPMGTGPQNRGFSPQGGQRRGPAFQGDQQPAPGSEPPQPAPEQ